MNWRQIWNIYKGRCNGMNQQTFFNTTENKSGNKKDWYSQIQEDEKRLTNMIKISVPAIPVKSIKDANNGK